MSMVDSTLPPRQQWTKKFPITGEREPAPGLSQQSLRLRITGLVHEELELGWADLQAFRPVELRADIHCVTRWSRQDMAWRGLDLAELLRRAGPMPDARFVRFLAHSPRSHDTSLPLSFCVQPGNVLLAYEMQGQAIPPEHGGPLRTVVPSLYFYKSLKWLIGIELLGEDRLGWWERHGGYHNQADPWKEQRYISNAVPPKALARYLAEGRFPSEALLQADLSGRELPGFHFAQARIKDSNFAGANLRGADFRGANLTNSDLRGCQLQGANFEGADLEGVRFARADLSGACLRGVSLTAAEFFEPEAGHGSGAELRNIDWTDAHLEGLVEEQIHFLRLQSALPKDYKEPNTEEEP